MLLPRPVQAEDRDSATVGKITLLNRKAVDAYQHLEFETAVRLLNEALEVSERAGLTQHPIRARTFVTLGIVTLGGFKQRDQAVKYFRKALQIQPEVRLSAGLANPEIQAAFDEAVAGLASGASDELPPEKALVHEPVQRRTGRAGRSRSRWRPTRIWAPARSCCATARRPPPPSPTCRCRRARRACLKRPSPPSATDGAAGRLLHRGTTDRRIGDRRGEGLPPIRSS